MVKAGTERVWRALGDPTRRRLLDLLRDRPCTTGELCAPFKLSRFAVMKHLGVLQRARLVLVERRGRQRLNHLNAGPLREVYERWVNTWADKWAAAGTRLKQFAETGEAMGTMQAIEIKQEYRINAPVKRVWEALVKQTAKWWPREFCTSERTRAFIIEPHLGGRAYEDWGNGEGHQWYQVIGVESPRYLLMLGQVSAQYGGPAMTMLKLSLEADGKATVLQLHDNTFGQIGETLQGQTEGGWKLLFDGFKKYAERAKSPSRR
jgi:DNA-binding transcriptional ArsR family regulator